MRVFIFLTVSLAFSFAFAAAECPTKSAQLKVCASTPKQGDSTLASGVFDSIAICSQGDDTLLVFEKNGESDESVAEVTKRDGGTTYLVRAEDVDFSLSVTTGIRPAPQTPARFTLILKDAKSQASSTYTCK